MFILEKNNFFFIFLTNMNIETPIIDIQSSILSRSIIAVIQFFFAQITFLTLSVFLSVLFDCYEGLNMYSMLLHFS